MKKKAARNVLRPPLMPHVGYTISDYRARQYGEFIICTFA